MCFINFHIRNHLKYKLSKMVSKIIGDSDRHILLRYVFQIASGNLFTMNIFFLRTLLTSDT